MAISVIQTLHLLQLVRWSSQIDLNKGTWTLHRSKRGKASTLQSFNTQSGTERAYIFL